MKHFRLSMSTCGRDPGPRCERNRALSSALRRSLGGAMNYMTQRTAILLMFVLAFSLSGCAGSAGAPSATGSPTSTSSPGPASPSPTIAIGTLQGKILFTRAGRNFGDETVFTADAAGMHEQRITGFGATCCPRWSSDGAHILIAASAPDGRITTGIIDPHGSLERKIPLPKGTLNLGGGAWSLTTGRLALEGWDDTKPGRNGIYTVRASDGGGLVQVTHSADGYHDRPMDFAPDGSRIFFFREASSSLFVVNADGTGLHQVTPSDMPVDMVGNAGGRLSPDGSSILFTVSGSIWVIHPDGSGLKKIFQDGKGRLAITPTWSPDGHLILFGLDPPGSLATTEVAPANGLYVMTADGTELTPLLISNDWKREPDW